jgi:ubiquinone/menaquinone biosynthesis C-methylase UbiE
MSKGNRRVKEWDVAAESWVDFVRQGKDYFRDELNNPGMFYLIGDMKGLLILDIACGEGYNTRLLAGKGAKVIGIDSSKKMIESAISQEEKDPLGIDYYVLDSKKLSRFSSISFDLVTCFMALMDIKDYDKTISEIARVIKNDGRFIFSITHPCFEYNLKTQELERTSKYFEARTEKISWNMERLLKSFETTSFHRTLTDYSITLYKHGFLIRRLMEPKPTKNGIKKFPPLKQILLTPHSIIIETIKNR